ncbi:MAG TPA: hypothetical protein VGO56_15025 [Pyrinomonadaceae bacterium]|nr:hypothetical protein [Pyrinomonadaceae bacterium]
MDREAAGRVLEKEGRLNIDRTPQTEGYRWALGCEEEPHEAATNG